MNLLALQQAIVTSGGPNVVIPSFLLLIVGVVLMVIGWALMRSAAPGKIFWNIMFWLGVACVVIWVILLILSLVFGFVCC